MSHPCFDCGGDCYCNGSIDDTITDLTPGNCLGCDFCQDMEESKDYDDYFDDENDEDNCPHCGHDRFDFSDAGCQICCPHLYTDDDLLDVPEDEL